MISGSAYAKIWKETRTYALAPDQVDSPLAARPYDLRHAAVSLWLNAGVCIHPADVRRPALDLRQRQRFHPAYIP